MTTDPAHRQQPPGQVAAERNLDERPQDVTMAYRRARQNVITAELVDVVAGFEALTTQDR